MLTPPRSPMRSLALSSPHDCSRREGASRHTAAGPVKQASEKASEPLRRSRLFPPTRRKSSAQSGAEACRRSTGRAPALLRAPDKRDQRKAIACEVWAYDRSGDQAVARIGVDRPGGPPHARECSWMSGTGLGASGRMSCFRLGDAGNLVIALRGGARYLEASNNRLINRAALLRWRWRGSRRCLHLIGRARRARESRPG